jgi:hypothetical protein
MVLRKKRKAATKAKARKPAKFVGSMTHAQLKNLVKQSVKEAFGGKAPMWPK